MAVSRFDLRTEVMCFGTYQHVGSVGVAEYNVIDRRADAKASRGPLNALTYYAWFCSTGRKTTQGIGQTRRLATWEPAVRVPK